MKPTWLLSRRAMLRGSGAALALPFLEAMVPPRAAHAAGPLRFIGWFHPNGFNKDMWTPAATGTGYTLTPSLMSLLPVKEDVLVITGLQQGNGTIGSHDIGLTALLTASTSNGATSIDQVIAEKASTRVRSLQLSLEVNGQYDPIRDSNNDGLIDSPTDEFDDTRDYCGEDDCRASILRGTRLPNMTNPRLVFERLFAGAATTTTGGGISVDTTALKRRRAMNKGLLDLVVDDSKRLASRLGRADKARLDEYMSGLFEIDRTMQKAEAPVAPTQGCAPPPKPRGMPMNLEARARLLIDMVVHAFACDVTRSATIMFGRHTTNMRFDIGGQSIAHHDASHWDGDPAKKKAKDFIDAWLVKQYAYLLQELKKRGEAGQTLLHNTVVFASSDVADPNLHDQMSLPVLVGGHAGGAFKTGRHIKTQGQIGDLFLSVLGAFGIQQAKFGEFGVKPLTWS